MNQIYINHSDSQAIKTFSNGPEKIAIYLDQYTDIFIKESGLLLNSQQHHEITRQCFDNIDLSYVDYFKSLDFLPRFELLVNNVKYFDINSNINNTGLNLKIATKNYGVGLFLSCHDNGIFINQKTSYILETIMNDICILQNCNATNSV